jgi:hypothetical protein
MNRTHLMSGGRYPVLRALGIMYLVMAGLALIGGLIAAGYILASQPWQITTRIVWSIVSLAGTFFAVVGFLAIAEVIKLFMDIEHSARQTAVNSAANFAGGATTTTASAQSVQIPVNSSTDGGIGHRNRLSMLDEETAEAALLRGH